ncbi:dihydrolipoyllysine-residue succinyltransferase component of 2-oxoglutarate dehydrogenase complex 1, mitochondrial [Daucus carota subsp. sativus]|uniref:dihydrolipoyllysine-residue succinyltransferase component of 2-oxoglutarate dehydrogenase complex 1, mitochondrial n=1 Tax=Daucus carota subsp. sativus TaxID=79200 RepID=UPI0007EF0F78|nr:PREDICTED: dihydrolipoyllysine-residue succinyltransferase component of 2-oxoglutarate dehydrogenase complex 1, mitochondrial-like [Daucus carota subsp. sativus]XP_017253918.1 PREDICTED: dihydrolipoyllysine-residue succinyltransferase component of 2-oxoglutarate dehydrogenase complex 1, mitochondrial-like [Daucus carota subsp. sativus]
MFAVIRRKLTSRGASSALLIGKSVRPALSTPRLSNTALREEIVSLPERIGNARHICHFIFSGCSTLSSRPTRKLIGSLQPFYVQTSRMKFSSDSGDLVEAVVPFMGESISDGTLATFLKQPGDKVDVDEPIAQVETDKVTIDVASPEAGVIQKFVAKEGDTVEPGTKIAVISKSGEGVAVSKKPSDEASPKPPATETKTEKKPESTTPPPPAPEKSMEKTPSLPPPRTSASEPQLPPKERERRVPMTRLRKRVASRLKDSQNTFALLTTFNEVDMTNLMKLRSDYKDAFLEKHGVKLGFMSGFVKAAVSGLQNQPVINAVIDGDDIIYRDYIDISIAVGTPKGLVVPVIRDADKMNFAEIEKEINNLAKKATAGSISIDEMAGGTFTISNGGVYGSLLSTPIINPPQSAILGMHSIVNRPMVVGGNIIARPMMYIALTYDHRLIDGREAVYFLRRIKDVVEDPRRLLLDI